MRCDVAVIGAGPAGSAAAILCRRAGLATALFTLPGYTRAVIPETLPVTARAALEELGIGEDPARLGLRPQYAMSSAWGSDSITVRHAITNPLGPGWFVDRRAFDGEVEREATRDGAVRLVRGHLGSAEREAEGWRLEFHARGEPDLVKVRATTVIDATGRASAFARRIGVRRIVLDDLIAVSGVAEPRGKPSGGALVEAAADGWWFGAPTPDGKLSITWFTSRALMCDSDRTRTAFERRLRATVHVSAWAGALVSDRLALRPARTERLESFGGDGWIASGDSAVACDPLGSQGVSRAFESAFVAAEVIVRNRTCSRKNLASYSQFQIDYLERFSKQRHYFYSMERRWPESAFWRRYSR